MPDQEVRDYAARLAKEINAEDGPSFVLWNSKNKIHVVMGKALPPEDLTTSLSLGQWRDQLRPAIAEELSKLGWEIKGGNRFWRGGANESAQADTKHTEKHQSIAALSSMVLGIAVVVVTVIGAVKGWMFDADRIGATAFFWFGFAFTGSLAASTEVPIRRVIRVNVVGAVVGGALFPIFHVGMHQAPTWWGSINLIFVPALLGISAVGLLLSNNPRSGIVPGLCGIWIAAMTTIGWLELWPIWMTLMLVFSLPSCVLFFDFAFVGEERFSWRRSLSVLGVLGFINTLIYSIATKDWGVFGGWVMILFIAFGIWSKADDKKSHIEKAKERVESGDTVRCPVCGSEQLSVNKKGFSAGKAAAGGLLVGKIGLLGGFAGSKKVLATCLQCGHVWTPGAM